MATVVDRSGAKVDVGVSPRRRRPKDEGTESRASAAHARKLRRQTPPADRKARSVVWDNALRQMGRTDLLCPETAIVPIVDRVGWTPDDEVRKPGPCSTCRDRIEPGSMLYCPKCQRTGFEDRLREQRSLRPLPPPERAVYKPKPKKGDVAPLAGRRGRPKTR